MDRYLSRFPFRTAHGRCRIIRTVKRSTDAKKKKKASSTDPPFRRILSAYVRYPFNKCLGYIITIFKTFRRKPHTSWGSLQTLFDAAFYLPRKSKSCRGCAKQYCMIVRGELPVAPTFAFTPRGRLSVPRELRNERRRRVRAKPRRAFSGLRTFYKKTQENKKNITN